MSKREFEMFLKQTIIEAGAVLQSLASPRRKSGDPTTREADLVLNDFLVAAISRRYPRHRYISEEDHTHPYKPSSFTWIIDPIDGTSNFYRGILAYTISMSLVHEDEILVGSVYEPYANRLFFASLGEGATMNDREIHVSNVSDLDRAILNVSKWSSFLKGGANGGTIFQKLVQRAEVRITSSTALDMCYVASGAIEARIMADTAVWDNSAATLIVQEAGGKVTDWRGMSQPFASPTLLASNGYCHGAILALLSESNSTPKHGDSVKSR
jgi:myo-inositol-1(or 4)-monophosphatase